MICSSTGTDEVRSRVPARMRAWGRVSVGRSTVEGGGECPLLVMVRSIWSANSH
ncbi:MAG: hypothetical protein ACYDHX_05505 [Methanothrix sp.]